CSQPEIGFLRVHEQRIGDTTCLVLSGRLPLSKALLAEQDRLARNVPVEIVVKRTYAASAVRAAVISDCLPFLEIDEVVPKAQLETPDNAPFELSRSI